MSNNQRPLLQTFLFCEDTNTFFPSYNRYNIVITPHHLTWGRLVTAGDLGQVPPPGPFYKQQTLFLFIFSEDTNIFMSQL